MFCYLPRDLTLAIGLLMQLVSANRLWPLDYSVKSKPALLALVPAKNLVH